MAQNKPKEGITTEKKKLIARVAVFILAIIIAIIAFTNGIVSIGHKEEGFYTLDEAHSEEAPFYGSDIEFNVYFEGNTNSIKRQINVAEKIYSDNLLWAYKVFDAKNKYDGIINLANVNNSIWSWETKIEENAASESAIVMLVSPEFEFAPELFDAILDAYGYTQEFRGYSIFAGALYDSWKNILILEDAESFDPINDEHQKKIIESITPYYSNPESFRIDVVSKDNHKLRFMVEKSYADLLKELECDINIIDFNILKNSYILKYTFEAMHAAGYEDCLVKTAEGLMATKGRYEGSQSLFDYSGEIQDTLYQYSFVDSNGKDISRNIYFNIYSGYQIQFAKSILAAKDSFDLFGPILTNVSLSILENAEQFAAEIENAKRLYGCEIEYDLK